MICTWTNDPDLSSISLISDTCSQFKIWRITQLFNPKYFTFSLIHMLHDSLQHMSIICLTPLQCQGFTKHNVVNYRHYLHIFNQHVNVNIHNQHLWRAKYWSHTHKNMHILLPNKFSNVTCMWKHGKYQLMDNVRGKFWSEKRRHIMKSWLKSTRRSREPFYQPEFATIPGAIGKNLHSEQTLNILM